MPISRFPQGKNEKGIMPGHTVLFDLRFSLQMVTNVYIHYARHEVLEKSISYKDVVVFSTPQRGVVGQSVGAAVEQTWKVLGFILFVFFFFYAFLFFSTFYTFGCYYTIFALGVAYCVLGAFAENYPVSSIELVFSTRTDSRWNETNTTNTDHTRLLYANVISFYSYVERELVLGCFSSRWSWTQSMHSYCVSRAAGTHQRRGGGRAAGEQSCTVPPDKETR